MTRKVWSKTRAEQRKDLEHNSPPSLRKSPRIFNRPSWPTTGAMQEDIASGCQNWHTRKELRRMSKHKNDSE